MSTEILQGTVPPELAEEIRARVRSGEYASESDIVIDLFHEHDLAEVSSDVLKEQLRSGLEAFDEMDRYPETISTAQDMRSVLSEHHRHRLQVQ